MRATVWRRWMALAVCAMGVARCYADEPVAEQPTLTTVTAEQQRWLETVHTMLDDGMLFWNGHEAVLKAGDGTVIRRVGPGNLDRQQNAEGMDVPQPQPPDWHLRSPVVGGGRVLAYAGPERIVPLDAEWIQAGGFSTKRHASTQSIDGRYFLKAGAANPLPCMDFRNYGFTLYDREGKELFAHPPDHGYYAALLHSGLLLYSEQGPSSLIKESDQEVLLVDTSGTERTRFTLPTTKTRANLAIRVSPDGRYFVARTARHKDPNSVLRLYREDGTLLLEHEGVAWGVFCGDFFLVNADFDRQENHLQTTVYRLHPTEKPTSLGTITITTEHAIGSVTVTLWPDDPHWLLVAASNSATYDAENRRIDHAYTRVYRVADGELIWESERVPDDFSRSGVVIGHPAPWDRTALITFGPDGRYATIRRPEK